MPGSPSWMPYAPQGVKGPDDDDDTFVQTSPQACILQVNSLLDISTMKQSSVVYRIFHEIIKQ